MRTALRILGPLLAVAAVCACATTAPSLARSAPTRLSLRLAPGTVEGSGLPSSKPSPARGTVQLRAPSAWGRPSAPAGHTVARYRVALAPRCVAEVEARGWIGSISATIRLQFEADEDFWFEVFAGAGPQALPLVAHHAAPGSIWEIATPPPASSPIAASEPAMSPFYAGAARRLARSRVWGVVHLGVRVPASCAPAPPQLPVLQHQLESVLRSARFQLRAH